MVCFTLIVLISALFLLIWNWDGNLRPFVPELLAWDDVLAELKRLLPNFFPDLIDRG